ncbi:MAG: hypothetical protein JOZ41_06605 [Chloroflexi bacterium]|nr:hypothetical protein [Chloroflexota bacterium]
MRADARGHQHRGTRQVNGRRIAALLLAVSAVTFWVASAIHFGVSVTLGVATVSDPFAGAAIPEAVVGATVALGSLALWSGRSAGRGIALATTGFAILVTLYGLSVTLSGGRTADVAYHVSVLAVLLVSLGMLLGERRRAIVPSEW